MARSVTVSLTAQVDGFIANMNRAAASTQSFASKAAGNIAKNDAAINKLSNGAGLMGAALALGIGAAVKSAADFDQAMSKVSATGDDARGNLDALRKAAIDAGASTAFSATEAAAGIENLAKAGVSAKDTLGGGLKGALDLAAAGSIDVGFAAETAATAMTQFGLAGSDVPHIADLLAAAAGKAQGEVSDFAGALNQSGLVASQFGLSIEETTGTLAAFASAGLLGSDAGTSLKTMLLRLANPSKEAADTMKDLGVNAYDAQGQFVGIESLAGQLQKSMSGLSDAQRDAALSTIFGSDAIRAANILYTQGAGGIQTWISNVNDAGFASETAAEKMNNLKGDIEGFKGALETAMIGLGSGAQGPLRDLVSGATDAVNAFNGLSDGAKSTVLSFGVAASGMLLGVAALGKLAIAANEAKVAMAALGITAKRAVVGIPAIGLALLAIGGAVSHFVGESAKAAQATEDFQGAMSSLSGQIDANTAALDTNVQAVAAKNLQDRGSFDNARTLGLNLKTVTDAALGNAAAMDSVRTSIKGALLDGNRDQVKAALDLGRSLNLVGTAADEARAKHNEMAEASGGAATAVDSAAAAADKEAQSLGYVSAAAKESAEAIKATTDAMYANANAALQLSGNAIAVEAAMDAAAAAAKKNGATLDLNTEKGRANQTALDQLAASTLQATQAMVEQNKPAADIVATNERARASYIKTARAMGLSRAEATDLANALFVIPKEIKSQVVVSGGKVSKQEAQDLNAALKSIPAEKRAEIVTIAETKGADAAYRAMAKVIDKEVTAATKGDPSGAKKVKTEMDRLKDKLVKALARGDEKGATKVINEMKRLRDKTVTAKANASGQGAVDGLRSSISRLSDKTVTVTVRRKGQPTMTSATGGLITHGGVLYRSDGGPVWGAGSATSDSIPAMLSNGEYVIKAASAMRLGIDRLQHMNRTGSLPGFASGGIVGASTGYGIDQALILRLIASLSTPLTAITAAARGLAAARSAKAREDREVAAARRAVRAGGATKGERASLNKQLEQQKDATAKLVDATKNLADANNAAADSARSMSAQFVSAFRSGSTDPQDLLASMLDGSAELSAFTAQIGQLRKAGLAESLIQQILGQGTGAGSETAANILGGGSALVKQLNEANKSLEKAADALGYLGSTSPQRKATGGFISGAGTGTSDSIAARLSNGEYVINAAATAAHRGLLDSINYGRSVVAPVRVAQTNYRSGGYVNAGSGVLTADQMALALSRMTVQVQNPWTGEYMDGRMRVVAGSVVMSENKRAEVSF